MAFVHTANKTKILINEREFSCKLRSSSLSHERQMGDVTTYCDAGNKFIPGLLNGSLGFEGFFEAGAAVHDELNSAVGTDNGLLVSVAPEGFAVGKPAFLAAGDPTNYDIAASVNDPVGFTVEAQPDDGVDWGVALHDLTAETATANGTSVDNTASSANGGVAILHVTAASGTTPSATIKVQHSTDNSVFTDLITMTAATAATSERKTATGTVNRYVRATWTISGTTPSFTFAVSFARR